MLPLSSSPHTEPPHESSTSISTSTKPYTHLQYHTQLSPNPFPSSLLLQSRIGSGISSSVHLCLNTSTSSQYALKIFPYIQYPQNRIKKQIAILQTLNGKNNCIKLHDILRAPPQPRSSSQYLPPSNTSQYNIGLLLQYAPSTRPHPLLNPNLSPSSCEHYFYEIFKALAHSHSLGIMHRDIKLDNVMIDEGTGSVKVVDWGSAEWETKGMVYGVAVGTVGYKSPEVLVGMGKYGCGVDVWAVGVMMAEAVLRVGVVEKKEKEKEQEKQQQKEKQQEKEKVLENTQKPLRKRLFVGPKPYHQLSLTTSLLSYESLLQFLDHYNIALPLHLQKTLQHTPSFTPLPTLVTPSNSHLATKAALDLISKILRYDPKQRLTAEQCMEHPYFSKVHGKK